MKKISIIFYILIATVLYAQNFSINGVYAFQEDSLIDCITLTDEWMEIEYKNPPVNKPREKFNYEIIHSEGQTFIQIDENFPPQVANWVEFRDNQNIQTDNRILILLGLRTNKIDNKKYNCMFAYTRGYPINKRTCTTTRFDNLRSSFWDCSSFLKEKNTKYPVENLQNLCPDTPWVEAVPGYGIGEGFSVKRNNEPFLLLINGYISYEKPYLYEQNGRIKKLRIKGLKTGKEIIVDVLDTPHPQTVDINELNENEDIRITIEDIYPGSKYEDTCLHYLLVWDEEIIPYENNFSESKKRDK